jgi:serine/threonine protein phosphatase 1
MLTIAIGDIHGMAAKLEALLERLEAWLAANAGREPRRYVLLGDYIDRGPHSREVLEIVRALQDDGAVCLRGNHEELMLRADRSQQDLANFLVNGGEATLASLGTRDEFERAKAWMRELATSYEDELRYFVHAGVMPGEPFEAQNDEIKLWIRDRFLRHRGAFPKYVVHGHTPTISIDPRQTTPDIRSNRCNLDTGAGMMGPLSAAIFDDRRAPPIHTISVMDERFA